MINEHVRHEIQEKLTQAQGLLQRDGVVKNLPSLKTKILQLELAQELQALEALLQTERFEEGFIARCKAREGDLQGSIPLTELPSSATNTLYWEIAKLLFPQKKTRGAA